VQENDTVDMLMKAFRRKKIPGKLLWDTSLMRGLNNTEQPMDNHVGEQSDLVSLK
jgi:hypothetical protein